VSILFVFDTPHNLFQARIPPMKILIVDDNASMRRMIRGILQPLADEIHECADGGEALETYARVLPDWVLMDIAMKRVDGITATRQIIEAYPQALVLMVTNYNDDDLRREAHEAGACKYLVKESLLDISDILSGGI
jgi:NarL family two-component system response regulator LiaR